MRPYLSGENTTLYTASWWSPSGYCTTIYSYWWFDSYTLTYVDDTISIICIPIGNLGSVMTRAQYCGSFSHLLPTTATLIARSTRSYSHTFAWHSLQFERRPSGEVVFGLKAGAAFTSPHCEHTFVLPSDSGSNSFNLSRSYLRCGQARRQVVSTCITSATG